jgi:flagellar motor switch protein FliM
VPLLGGMLEKHAEGEIRKFSEIELSIVEDELRKGLTA